MGPFEIGKGASVIRGTVFDIMRYSTRDGPGIRTTVFLKGCPLSCWWCHNPESQSSARQIMIRPERCIGCLACLPACPQGAISAPEGSVISDLGRCTVCDACAEVCYSGAREIVGRDMTVAEVIDQVERDRAFYDESGGGVTFSGGEPLYQPRFLAELLRACRERGIHTAIDTSGLASWETLDGLRACVDLFLYDIKTINDERHRQATGVSNQLILHNLERLSGWGHRIIVRVPVIPGFNDDDDSVRRIGEFAARLHRLERVGLLPYHQAGIDKYRRLNKPYTGPDLAPPSDERIAEIARQLAGFGLQVKIGG